MLALQTDVKGSAGYVALERVTGKLAGKQGSFVLQHSATMYKGDADAKITVVPDSATGELARAVGQDDHHRRRGRRAPLRVRLQDRGPPVGGVHGDGSRVPGVSRLARTSRVRRIAVSTPW